MRIAIDCRLISLTETESQYTGTVLIPLLLKQGNAHHFFLISDRAFSPKWSAYQNATCLVLKPATVSAATRGIWYDIGLPALLIKHQIEVFLGMAGYISLRSPIRQFLWLHDAYYTTAGDEATGWMGKWYRRRLPAMLKKAVGIGVAAFGKSEGHGEIGAVGDNPNSGGSHMGKEFALPVAFVPGRDGVDGDNTVNSVDSLNLGDMPYFLCFEGWQTMEDAMAVLLAFSAFKKRMQSGMKLVLAGNGPRQKDWKEKLTSYRFREDVVVLPHISANTSIALLQSAYALIHLPDGGHVKWLLAALQCHIPVITKALPVFWELGADALMYCTNAPGESLAQNLMRMYKDENNRTTLISKGKHIAAHMTPEIAAGKILMLLEATF